MPKAPQWRMPHQTIGKMLWSIKGPGSAARNRSGQKSGAIKAHPRRVSGRPRLHAAGVSGGGCMWRKRCAPQRTSRCEIISSAGRRDPAITSTSFGAATKSFSIESQERNSIPISDPPVMAAPRSSLAWLPSATALTCLSWDLPILGVPGSVSQVSSYWLLTSPSEGRRLLSN